MQENIIHFILVPDAGASRRIRRAVADIAGGIGLMVGSVYDLVREARAACLSLENTTSWTENVGAALSCEHEGFWNDSYEQDPLSVTNIIERTLEEILWASPDAHILSDPELPRRARERLKNFTSLHEAMEFALPKRLQAIVDVLARDPEKLTKHFSVYHIKGFPRLNQWECRLVAHLNSSSEATTNPDYLQILKKEFQTNSRGASKRNPSDLAAHLYSGKEGTFPPEDTVRLLAVRDALEEAEIAAGMILRHEADGVPLSRIGLLLPNDSGYASAIAEVCGSINIPLAGLYLRVSERNIAGEFTRQILMGYEAVTPRMAIASLVTSPLMPWDARTGQDLARRIMRGKGLPSKLENHSANENRALELLKSATFGRGSPVSILEEFCTMAGQSETRDDHVISLQSLKTSLSQIWPEDGNPNWDIINRLTSDQHNSSEIPPIFPKNGVVVISETEEPWSDVDHLIVLGFSAGHYPLTTGVSPVFFESEKQAINKALGFELETSEVIISKRRQLFQRQLSAAHQTATIFVPRRDFQGSAVQPSETLIFMARLMGETSGENLLLDPHDPEVHARVPSLLVGPESIEPPRPTNPQNLELGCDLTELRKDKDGVTRPESPSSLETLLVSPFAWLLRGLGAEPSNWEVDTLGSLEQGTIAHAVFEDVFPEGKDLPELDDIPELVEEALQRAIEKHLPIAKTAQWRVERENLKATILAAARRWRELLIDTGAKIVGVETDLHGEFSGILIHGKTDAVLELPNGRLVVVDFKKSSSGKRQGRMELGYDCQVSLYRKMIETGGPKSGDGPLAKDKTRSDVGVMYFLLNDQMALTDEAVEFDRPVHGVMKVKGDVSRLGIAELLEKISGLKKGLVSMNHVDDPKNLSDNKNLPIYAFEKSPLINLFSHTDPQEDAE